MFKNLADDLSIWLEGKKLIKSEKREIFFHGLQLAFSKLLLFIIVLIISLFTETFLVSMIFLLILFVIESFSWVFNSKPEVSNLLVSILFYLIMLLFYDIDTVSGQFISLAVGLISTLFITVISPIGHKSKPITVNKFQKCKVTTVIAALALAIIMCASLLLNSTILFYSSSYAITADSILVILAIKDIK